MADMMQVCKAGAAGCCSVILIVFGVFIAFPGVTLLAIGSAPSDTAGHDDVYEDTNRELQIAGAVMLVIGLILIVIAVVLCCYVCRKMHGSSSQPGMVLSTNPSQTTATVTTGYSAVPTQPQQGGPPQPTPQYPPQNQYPPQPHPYPPPQQNQYQQYPPPQQYPPQQYQHMQGAPAPQYPMGTQQQNYDKQPPMNPNYPAAAQPSAPFPTLDRPPPVNPSAPPQHKMSFKR